MVSEHIHNAYCGQTHLVEVRTLRHAGSYEQTAVAATLDGEIVLRCIALIDEQFGCCNEVVEDVLLLQLRSCHMPFLAVLSATTQNCMHVNAPALHKGDVVGEEEGIV